MFEFLKHHSPEMAEPTITQVMPAGLTYEEARAEAANLVPGEEVVADLRRHYLVKVPEGCVVEVVYGS